MSELPVFLVDDHQIVLDGLRSIIQSSSKFKVVGVAKNGLDALRYIQSLQPEIVLLDIDMPKMNGIAVAEQLKKDGVNTKIIILSLHHENSIIKHLIQIGVDGYLLKDSDSAELLRALDLVAQGKKYFSADVTLALTKPTENAARLTSSKSDASLISSITEREKEIIRLICEGLTNKEIANRLFISTRTADAHRSNVMKKLNVKNVVGVVKFAIRTGISPSLGD